MKKLIILTAIPGAGKTTWALNHQKNNPNTFIVSSDEIRLELFGEYQNLSNEKLVWQRFKEKPHEYAEKYDEVTVILDAINGYNKYRIEDFLRYPEFDKAYLVYLKTPLEKALIQNKMRPKERWIPDEAIIKYYNSFEEPDDEVKKVCEVIIVE